MSTLTQKTNIIDLLIPLLALGLITFGIGNYGLYEPHESHFTMVGNEMVWRGDWVTPYLNGAPYLNKPPLLYWLIAISTTFFGNTEFAARFPIAIAGWLGIIIAGKWSKDLWGITAYRMTVLMLSVTLGWFIFAHQILTDILLATLILASNYFLWKIINKPQSWLYFFALYSSIALCLLTKGLIGGFFIFCSYVALAIYHRSWQIITKTKLLAGILFILALILPWSWAIEKANPGFWHYFIFNEHIARIFDRRLPPDYTVSKINPWGYLGFTALWCFPWILFLPSTFKLIWQKIRKTKVNETSESEAILLLTILFFLPILIFLPLSSRLIYYSLPGVPAYIILCTGTLIADIQKNYQQLYQRLGRIKFNLNSGLTIYGLILTIIGVITVIAIAFFPVLFKYLIEVRGFSFLSSLMTANLILLALGFLFAGIELFKLNYHLSFKALVFSLGLIYCITTPMFSFYQDMRSSKALVAIVDHSLPVNTLWIFEGSREIGAAAGLTYYLNQGKDFQQTETSLANNEIIPVGLVAGKGTKIYRNVLVLEDGGDNRIPPKFPGAKPDYLIDQQQLQTYWNSLRPVVFVTDFLRDFNNPQDPINRNLPKGTDRPLLKIGNRQIYLNQAAINIINKQINSDLIFKNNLIN